MIKKCLALLTGLAIVATPASGNAQGSPKGTPSPKARASAPATPKAPLTIAVTSASSIEAKLAVLELDARGAAPIVPMSLVRDFEIVLAKIDGPCAGNRAQIADMGVRAVQILREDGRKMGYLEWFRGIDSLLVASKAKADDSTDCRVVFASALTMLGK